MDVTRGPLSGAGTLTKVEGPTLKADTLNLFDTTAIAVASVAPAYSIAATTFLLVAAVGLGTPAMVVISFVPVLFIAMAYYFMNKRDPDCGASYAWLARTMSPYIGWFNGWVQTAASVIFCVAAPVLAGTNTLGLLQALGWVSAKTASNTFLTAIIALAWLIFVSAMVIYGIRLTANFQWIMVGLEYLVVLAFSITGLVRAIASHPAGTHALSLSWLSPGSIGGISGLAVGAALGVFLFWGWDTAVNLNEESEESDSNPGIAGILSMFILLVIFLVNATSMQAFLPVHTIVHQGGNALFYFAQRLAPAPFSYLMLLAILSSTVATTQTTLLPASRVTYSMARDGVFPKLFGKISPRFHTPAQGTSALFLIAGVGRDAHKLLPHGEQHLLQLDRSDRGAGRLLLRHHRPGVCLGISQDPLSVRVKPGLRRAHAVGRRNLPLLGRLPGHRTGRGRDVAPHPHNLRPGHPARDRSAPSGECRLLPPEDGRLREVT